MSTRIVVCLCCLALVGPPPKRVSTKPMDVINESAAALRARIEASPKLPFHGVHFAIQPPSPGWVSGAVSGVAIGRDGSVYEIQRGDKADPVLVADHNGKLLRSWGKDSYTIPHSIRIDPEGNVWTVDAASSDVVKYSPLGKRLMTIPVGEQPENGSLFNGTTDVAFGPGGRVFITDGYGNARVLEYTSDGRRVRQWGKPGTGPGEFRLPHAIQIDENGTIYIADRENGRIQKFDLNGKFLGEIPRLGRVYAIKLSGDALWASMSLPDQLGSPGWVIKLDRDTGRLLGHLDVSEPRGLHALELSPSGEPIITLGDELLRFKAN